MLSALISSLSYQQIKDINNLKPKNAKFMSTSFLVDCLLKNVTHYENMPIQNILKILPQKNENFQRKNSDIFHFSAQNIDCWYSLEPPHRDSSNEYPQSMFLSRNKKNNVYPYKPQFYYIKVGFKGVKII